MKLARIIGKLCNRARMHSRRFFTREIQYECVCAGRSRLSLLKNAQIFGQIYEWESFPSGYTHASTCEITGRNGQQQFRKSSREILHEEAISGDPTAE